MGFITDYLDRYFDTIEPKAFYRALFPLGELEETGKMVSGKYNAIAVELLPPEKDNENNVRKYVITDSLEVLDTLLASDNFIIISPISYIGRNRTSKNARFIYALAIDLDGIETEQNLVDFFYQVENDILPKPTYVVSSGNGIHLYYQFEKPLPCFQNITKQLADLKMALTKKIWNKYITTQYDKPQIQSLFQGFRIVGGITKNNDRTKAFITGNKIDIDYLNSFVDDKYKVKQFRYKSDLTLKEAAEKYPEWYNNRIVKKKPKGTWTCKDDLYYWWLNRLKTEIAEGHRYYGIMCLCIYAKKCDIDRDTLEKDAFSLLDIMEKLTTDEKNHFTRQDILAALEMYNDNYMTFPIDTITTLTNLPIEKNKRNGRKQELHLRLARANKAILKEAGEMKKEGRPSKQSEIEEWQRLNTTGTKRECAAALGVSRATVYKYWVE